jgi:HSP20 family protein
MFSLIPYRKAEPKLAREFARPFGRMGSELAELFDRFFAPWPLLAETPWEEISAGLEVVDREKEVLVRVEVPGFEPGELVVEVTGNVLTIRGEHKEKEEKKEAAERPYYRLMRSLMLPVGIDVEKVEVTCKNGLLEVILPKKPEAMTRRIEVKP